jgi:hypothetical protein
LGTAWILPLQKQLNPAFLSQNAFESERELGFEAEGEHPLAFAHDSM